MVFKVPLNRRQFGAGLAAAAAVPFTGLAPRFALAGEGAATVPLDVGTGWAELDALTAEASRLGFSTPRMGLGPSTQSAEITELAPAILDFMGGVEESAPEARSAQPSDTASVLDRASDLLIRVTQHERSPREEREEDEEEGLTEEERSLRAAARPKMPPVEELAGEYTGLFNSCKIHESRLGAVNQFVDIILKPDNRKKYEAVYEETCVPWFFTACIHGLEASFNFKAHLHNGDSLKNRTWQEPPGLPKEWNPPNDWPSSAKDAIKHDKLDLHTTWTLPEMLYRWERYNGVSSRLKYHINTPYLWSFSQHYTRGKFVHDGVWDGNAVSKQPGAAVLLRRLVDRGEVKV